MVARSISYGVDGRRRRECLVGFRCGRRRRRGRGRSAAGGRRVVRAGRVQVFSGSTLVENFGERPDELAGGVVVEHVPRRRRSAMLRRRASASLAGERAGFDLGRSTRRATGRRRRVARRASRGRRRARPRRRGRSVARRSSNAAAWSAASAEHGAGERGGPVAQQGPAGAADALAVAAPVGVAKLVVAGGALELGQLGPAVVVLQQRVLGVGGERADELRVCGPRGEGADGERARRHEAVVVVGDDRGEVLGDGCRGGS